MSKFIKLYSKSSVEQDWTCPRKYHWNYCYGGKGITKEATHLSLFLGTSLHDGLAAIAHGVDIDEIGETAREQVKEPLLKASEDGDPQQAIDFANEQAALVEGLLRGFHRYVWPRLMDQYPTIIAIEQPCLYKYDGLAFMARPDLLLADRQNQVVYIEYKSSSSKKVEWVNSWNTSIQLHSGVKAVEQTLGTAPQSVIVIGLYKGFISYSKQNSPMCYCYKKSGNPPFTTDQIQYEFKAGFKRYPTWELDGGVKKWVEDMPEQILGNQFMQTPPIFVNEDLVMDFFAQQASRQAAIAGAVSKMTLVGEDGQKILLDEAFPQRFSECSPAWGSPCSYRQLCFGDARNPLESGYEWRNDEHQQPFKDLLKE